MKTIRTMITMLLLLVATVMFSQDNKVYEGYDYVERTHNTTMEVDAIIAKHFVIVDFDNDTLVLQSKEGTVNYYIVDDGTGSGKDKTGEFFKIILVNKQTGDKSAVIAYDDELYLVESPYTFRFHR